MRRLAWLNRVRRSRRTREHVPYSSPRRGEEERRSLVSKRNLQKRANSHQNTIEIALFSLILHLKGAYLTKPGSLVQVAAPKTLTSHWTGIGHGDAATVHGEVKRALP